MERQGRGGYAWRSCEELGVGPDAEKAIAESIRAKVRRQPAAVHLAPPRCTYVHV